METAGIFKSRRDNVIEEWRKRLRAEVSVHPVGKGETFCRACPAAHDPDFRAFARNEFFAVDPVTQKMGEPRGEPGFLLSHEQNAFEPVRPPLDVTRESARERNIVIGAAFPAPLFMIDYGEMGKSAINPALNLLKTIRNHGKVKITAGREGNIRCVNLIPGIPCVYA